MKRFGFAVIVLAISSTGFAQSKLTPLPEGEFGRAEARHLLLRAGFGGTPEQVAKLHGLGLRGAVDSLVDYESQADRIPDLALGYIEQPQRAAFVRMNENERRRVRQRIRRQDQAQFARVRNWWVQRLLHSARPLEEKMTLFWHGHFTSSYRDVRSAKRMLRQNQLLRLHATSNFGELLHRVAADPAMLDYLDNNQNRRGRPNENFAREVMELFTLGEGKYSERDIKEAARAFTGMTFQRRTGRYFFNAFQHDSGVKTVFGKRGRFGGAAICRLLLEHEACAPFVAGKLWSWFAGPDPDPALAAELGAYFRSCRYEIKPLLRKVFMSRAFYAPELRGALVKSPTVFVVSTIKQLGMTPPPANFVAAAIARLGQQLMMPPNVKGWEEGTAWITSSALLDRSAVCASLIRSGSALATSRPSARRDRATMESDRMQGDRRQSDRRQSDRRRQADRRARQARGRAAQRRAAQARLAAWRPDLSVAKMVAAAQPTSAADVVDALCNRLLVVPLADETRNELLGFVRRAAGSDSIDAKALRGPAVERKLRELLHLVMSTPEFQVL